MGRTLFHDIPQVAHEAAWSFLENIRESVRRFMDDKASAAYSHLSAHLTSPPDQRMRAVYQREMVRRYNGGTEFIWSRNAWKISPSNCGGT